MLPNVRNNTKYVRTFKQIKTLFSFMLNRFLTTRVHPQQNKFLHTAFTSTLLHVIQIRGY